ncbi:hypothetical protein [Pontibacter sp. G13]|uniref:hypothetical protein n=1 Tax=Pontibacter sp. G13 TaxID=3074898 RepID=UPI00288A6307|nr:hypothetical protein [Pontibacter sp. G13]WNJ17205.1 hypothetical protein RJD25_20305 [Pontibacter sp. G13]
MNVRQVLFLIPLCVNVVFSNISFAQGIEFEDHFEISNSGLNRLVFSENLFATWISRNADRFFRQSQRALQAYSSGFDYEHVRYGHVQMASGLNYISAQDFRKLNDSIFSPVFQNDSVLIPLNLYVRIFSLLPGGSFKLYIFNEDLRQGVEPVDLNWENPGTYFIEGGKPDTVYVAESTCSSYKFTTPESTDTLDYGSVKYIISDENPDFSIVPDFEGGIDFFHVTYKKYYTQEAKLVVGVFYAIFPKNEYKTFKEQFFLK